MAIKHLKIMIKLISLSTNLQKCKKIAPPPHTHTQHLKRVLQQCLINPVS